ncbi:hypothetical protein [Consotaella salsifontis]|uniref:hypothetical protein n=1 Tax=Consotaella salsifontis TaxID=1365950 RepID=UPI0010545637|nr:hypothetical protein [Consotaella salsifontis]
MPLVASRAGSLKDVALEMFGKLRTWSSFSSAKGKVRKDAAAGKRRIREIALQLRAVWRGCDRRAFVAPANTLILKASCEWRVEKAVGTAQNIKNSRLRLLTLRVSPNAGLAFLWLCATSDK